MTSAFLGIALVAHLMIPAGTQIPAQFLGRYTDALGSCESASAFVHVQPNAIDWFSRTDRVLFIEPISETAIHVFVTAPDATAGVRELHFELQGDGRNHLLVSDHLSAAEDIAQRGSVIPDKSVVGFLQRCP